MEEKCINILLIEDNPGDARLIEFMFSEVRQSTFEISFADRLSTGIDHLQNNEFDIVLLDLSLPDSVGLETFTRLHAQIPHIPIIVLTGLDDEAMAGKAVREGAQDYLVKGEIDGNLLARATRYAIERHRSDQALRESEERYSLAVLGANDGIWDWNLSTDHIYYSPRWKAMLGYAEKEIGETTDEWFSRVHPDEADQLRLHIQSHLEGNSSHLEYELRMQHKDGSYRWMLIRGLAVRSESGNAYRMAGSQTDITDRKRAEEQLRHEAFFDKLTNLPNRALFMDRLKRILERAKRQDHISCAVLFMDIDRFKVINDSFGHKHGDGLLVELSHRLHNCLRASDTVARFGGDEFVLLLEDLEEHKKVYQVADQIQEQLALPFTVQDRQVFVTASIGILLNHGEYKEPEEAVRDAEIAMYHAKADNNAKVVVFNTLMHSSAVARFQMEAELHRAIKHQEFFLHFQPIISLKTGKITGFEALLRWQHPERGVIPPGEFIPICEETGLIIPIGDWVLRTACKQLQLWHREFNHDPPLTMSVNLSGQQFTQRDLVERTREILSETELDGKFLRLEITESVIMEKGTQVTMALLGLQTVGVQIQIDDFGTGYSSLGYLHQLPIDAIKIDRSFINVDLYGNNSQIVRTIIRLAHDLGKAAIAEGVETKEQLEMLNLLDCEYGQGFLFAKPLSSQAATQLLANGLELIPGRDDRQKLTQRVTGRWFS